MCKYKLNFYKKAQKPIKIIKCLKTELTKSTDLSNLTEWLINNLLQDMIIGAGQWTCPPPFFTPGGQTVLSPPFFYPNLITLNWPLFTC